MDVSLTGTDYPLRCISHTLDLFRSGYFEKTINTACGQLKIGTMVYNEHCRIDRTMEHRLSKIESLKEQKPKLESLALSAVAEQ